MKKFTWTVIYKEIAKELLNYQNKQEELICIINKHELGQQFTNPKNRTSSMDGKIDPFTFFSFFNRGLKKENRKKFLEILLKEFKLESPLPNDFKGIPITNNQKAWFFDNTEKDKISLLWKLFRELVEGSINGASFNEVLSMKGMGVSLITKGLYWVDPQNSICLNHATIRFLEYKGLKVTKIVCFDDYKKNVTRIKNSKELRQNSNNAENLFLEITLRAHERLWLEDIWSFVWPRSSNLVVQKNMIKRKIDSLNIILYGPPGTGKTYKLKNEYLKIFYRSWMIDFASEQTTTWWDVIFLAMLDLSFKGKLSLKSPDKILSKHDFIKGREKNSNNNSVKSTIRSHLQRHTPKECTEVNLTEERKKPMLFWKVGPGEFKINDNWSEENRDYVIELAEKFKKYCKSLHTFITFHQSFSYEDFIEGIKPVFQNTALIYEIKDGAFLEMVKQAETPEKKKMNHVIFIDEINRGNISNIFGELITLIEKDKRASTSNEISVKLPYSGNEFAIPSNLYIIATMNTADRSIEAIDSALRRRFDFIEVAPDAKKIKSPIIEKNIDLEELLIAINKRLLVLIGKDKLIGHSYFMNINSIEDLVRTFKNKIIPLLEEYFYNDRQKILMVLGPKFVKKKEWKKRDLKLFFDSTDDLEDVITYEFTEKDKWNNESFKSIYEEQNNKNNNKTDANGIKQDNNADSNKQDNNADGNKQDNNADGNKQENNAGGTQ